MQAGSVVVIAEGRRVTALFHVESVSEEADRNEPA